ncbi:unnamed protein product, partial [Rotaria magnacalcarata]
QLKNVGRNNRTLPPSRMINQLAGSMKLTDAQLGMIPRQNTLYQSVYHARSKTIPPLPKSVNFGIPAAFSNTSSDEKFIFFDHLYSKQTKRIIAFASPMQLNILFTAKLICVDGTFSICPRIYKQLLIILAIDRHNYSVIRIVFFCLYLATPVVYVLLNDKTAHTYTLLFQSLKNKAKDMNMKFEPIRIISDYESGMISTLKKELPNTIHQGCLFHLYQGLTKQIKKIGLWAYYENHDELHLFIKKVMAIVLLKPVLMDNAYELLAKQYLKSKKLKQFTVQLTKFMLYFQKQWMKIKMRTMISFYEVDLKTNNWSESYDAVLQRRAQQSHLSMWTLIELLITEETSVRMKHFQLLNGKTKSVNKTVRDSVIEINNKIIEFNQNFEDDEITIDDCLTSISALVGVKYDKWPEMVQGALDDDCYQKLYPIIASEVLLKNLIQFVQNINNRPTQDNVQHGTLYKKSNGRQIDSSRRYYLVKKPNLNEFNLYAKISKGRNLGFYRIYTNQNEIEILLKYDLNYLKCQGKLPSVIDCLQYVQDSKYLIARERCEFISRLLNNNVAAARDTSSVDYDVTKLGIRPQQPQKCLKESTITPTASSSTSPPTHKPRAQKQVLPSPKTTLSLSTVKKSTSCSQSSSDEHSPSPPLKKQKNKNNKLIKKQKQQHVLKTTTEQATPVSYLHSTPILSRLRVRPNNHIADAASSSSTSSSQPRLIATTSKNKQIAMTKKRGHSSKYE